MSLRACLLLGLLLPWSAVQAQLEVRSDIVSQLTGVGGVTSVGDSVIVTGDASGVQLRPCGMITVTTEAANVEIEAEDRDRRMLPVRMLDSSDGVSRYLIEHAGRVWVDVVAIDFQKNIYRRRSGIVLDIPDASPVVPDGPDIEPPSPELQSAVRPITIALSDSPEKAHALSAAFTGFADGVSLAIPSSIEKLREVLYRAITLLDVPKGTKVGDLIDEVVAVHVGITVEEGKWIDRPTTDDDRKKLADVFDAIAWGCTQ